MARKGSKRTSRKKTKTDDNPPIEKTRAVVVLSPQQEQAAKFLARYGYRPGQTSKSGALIRCCERFQIVRATLYKWLQIPEFAAKVLRDGDRLEDDVFDAFESAVKGSADHAPNGKLIQLFLEARYPEVYDRSIRRQERRFELQTMLAKMLDALKKGGLDLEDWEIHERETLPGERLAIPSEEE